MNIKHKLCVLLERILLQRDTVLCMKPRRLLYSVCTSGGVSPRSGMVVKEVKKTNTPARVSGPAGWVVMSAQVMVLGDLS